MTLRLRTFGAVCLERGGVPLTGTHAQRRKLALLACLASTRGAPITRDKLLGLFWPERREDSARHSLSQLLYALRQELPAGAVIATADEVRLDPALLSSDVHDFLAALEQGQDEAAVAHYQGEFLDGFFLDDAPEFEQWLEAERRRLRARLVAALKRLAAAALQADDLFAAAEWQRRLVATDRSNGALVRALAETLQAAGDRNGALREVRRYEQYVRGELEDEPEADVVALRLRMEAQHGRADTSAQPAPARSTPTTTRASSKARGWWPKAFATLLVLALIAVAVTQTGGVRSGDAGVMVLIGDLEGTDSALSLAVREALRAELAATERVSIVSEQRAREIEILMRAPPARALRPPLLFEAAARSGAQIAITGSAIPLGTGVQVVIHMHEAATGETLRTVSARADQPGEVVPALSILGRSLASELEEIPVDTAVRPLPAVTTTSLPALKSFALARRAWLRGARDSAIYHAERALMHDSTFVVAHYLAGDALWFQDRQTHAEAHLTRAYELAEALPYRERLVVRARYEQIVADRADSALAYWDQLRDAAPRDPFASEGRAWTLRALGRYEEAVLAARAALQQDPRAISPNSSNAVFSLLSVGDTAGARAFAIHLGDSGSIAVVEANYHAALVRDDIAAALQLAAHAGPTKHVRLQETYIQARALPAARRQLEILRRDPKFTHRARALLIQGAAELEFMADTATAARYARAALEDLVQQDLSAPGLARLAERIGELAARAGDVATIDATIRHVQQRDGGRNLHSHMLALRALRAARLYALGDVVRAADLIRWARHGVYFSRSLNTLVRMEADARRASGDVQGARELYDMIEQHEIADGDYQTWLIMRTLARHRTGRLVARHRELSQGALAQMFAGATSGQQRMDDCGQGSSVARTFSMSSAAAKGFCKKLTESARTPRWMTSS